MSDGKFIAFLGDRMVVVSEWTPSEASGNPHVGSPEPNRLEEVVLLLQIEVVFWLYVSA